MRQKETILTRSSLRAHSNVTIQLAVKASKKSSSAIMTKRQQMYH